MQEYLAMIKTIPLFLRELLLPVIVIILFDITLANV